MSVPGFIQMQRDRFRHPLFKPTKTHPWCPGYAWDWMVAEAFFEDRRVSINGVTVTLHRGQFSHSIRYMAEAWGWDVAVVHRFIIRLKTETMIATDTATGQSVITICNYDKYQSQTPGRATGRATGGATGAQQERNGSATKKNDAKEGKEGKEREEEDSRPNPPKNGRAHGALSAFDPVWKTYPRKVGRGAAEKAWTKALATVLDASEITGPLAAFSAAAAKTELRFVPHLATWLNQRRWLDETEPKPPPEEYRMGSRQVIA